MNKRVVLDEFRFALSPEEEAILEGLKNKEFLKSFGGDQEIRSSSKRSSKGSRVDKKSKVIWTKDLHSKFLEAIEKLGIDKAVPKKIVKLMNVDGITRDHVASHLQKYRLLSKRIASANYGVQNVTKPSLLASSMTNDTSRSHSSLMPDQEQMNWPSCGKHAINPLILDTSSSYVSVLDASDFNATNKGYSMQAMNKNLDRQRNFIDDTTNFGVVNSVSYSNSGFVKNLDADFFHKYGGSSTEVQICNNYEMGSSGGMQYSSNSSFVQNPNGFECNYSRRNAFVETGSLYGAASNCNLENGIIGEDDMILSDVDIACLLSFANDNNQPPPNKEMNWQSSPDLVSVYSNHEEHTSINPQQTVDAYLPGFDPTFDELMDEPFVEPVWSPDLMQMVRQFKA